MVMEKVNKQKQNPITKKLENETKQGKTCNYAILAGKNWNSENVCVRMVLDLRCFMAYFASTSISFIRFNVTVQQMLPWFAYYYHQPSLLSKIASGQLDLCNHHQLIWFHRIMATLVHHLHSTRNMRSYPPSLAVGWRMPDWVTASTCNNADVIGWFLKINFG